MASVANRSRTRSFRSPEAPVEPDGYRSHKAAIEDYLSALSFSENPRFARLIQVMRDSLSAGGSRIRPLLCMEAAGAFGLDPTDALPAATAVELLHTGSLVHGGLSVMGDDLGGRDPSYHAGCDDATVILAGDACFSEAVAMISYHQEGDPAQLVESIRELAIAVGASGMIGGQALTVGRGKRFSDPETLNVAYDRRTGCLLVAAARIGAILGGATAEEKGIVAEYARHLALCMRVSSDPMKTGSPGERPEPGLAGEAARREKAFYIRTYGLPGVRRLADEALRKALEALRRLDRDTRGLAEVARFASTQGDHQSLV